ncbi:hypothetical protein MASR2M78_28260 [Treponema sp.]
MVQVNRHSIRGSVVIFFLVLIVSACVSRPINPPPEVPVPPVIEMGELLPQADLSFVRISAKNPDELQLVFELSVQNMDSLPYQLQRLETELSLNGIPAARLCLETALHLPAGSSNLQELSFAVDLRDFPDLAADELQYDLAARLEFRTNSDAGRTGSSSLQGSFLRVQKPLFRISSIKIHRAQLINTRMNVSLEIENPNGFTLELSALQYELFGEGRYWAEGNQTAVFQIESHAKMTLISQITMNFIDMKRELLDQFIKMQDVGYRFKGNIRVLTGMSYLPHFIMNFDERGRTPVIE